VTERHAAFFICLGERKKENLTDRAISRFIIFNIIFLFKKKKNLALKIRIGQQ
jgi:hypothetical protein